MGVKGDRNRSDPKKFRDNAEQSGIPDLSFNNIAEATEGLPPGLIRVPFETPVLNTPACGRAK